MHDRQRYEQIQHAWLLLLLLLLQSPKSTLAVVATPPCPILIGTSCQPSLALGLGESQATARCETYYYLFVARCSAAPVQQLNQGLGVKSA